ncbi:DUF4134 domain-containing protein [[Flexibacter] sp. ATCC 35208]|uniref:DUF4134 domain-containing protein n=1 Tax=[Flexibacter] sp. ATCC 35208 TaxID=1936242 RepID=UPI0009CAFF11|nr:DUF4134 domain-containing protein [[Flexibacter] sp. ATCC 35208]OMP80083.1 hypothetical protein BW716_06210 [[Flexibacter] sp. ATCC 35208]
MRRSEVRKCREANLSLSVQFTALVTTLLCVSANVFAQTASGSGGITAATKEVAGYFGIGCTLMYAIGAIVGIVGAIKVYNKWNQGEQDTGKVAAAWFGSCIFLVVVATVLKGFFGV